jgi:glycerophosphoryl diester phosphodiesterase
MKTLPSVYAHRGASAHAPENTLAAFTLAVQQGVPALEMDVKLTTDRHLVIFHDQTVDRTTDGSGRLASFSLAALRELDAGSRFDVRFTGEKIPTLQEVFETLGGKVFFNLELTNYSSPWDGLAQEVAALVKRFGLQESVLFSSFFPTNLATTRRLLPLTPRGQLFLPGGSSWWQRLSAGWMSLDAEHPSLEDVSAAWIEKAHRRGRRVQVWTVNDPADMRRLKQMGVDAIFTDDPPLALKEFA